MRYTGVMRKRVSKGLESYIGEARVLLGRVDERIQNSNGILTQYQLQRKYDGIEITAFANSTEHIITIKAVGEDEDKKELNFALYSLIPKRGYPQMIIKEKSNLEIYPKGFSFSFNEDIKSGAAHSQDNTNENLAASVQNNNNKNKELLLSIDAQSSADTFVEGEMFYKKNAYRPLRCEESYGYTSFNVYAGGYLLFTSSYPLLGAAEIGAFFCFIR